MKNFLMIIAVLLFSATTAFSQTYKVHVGWQTEECDCNDQGHSYYAVKVVIYDEANDIVVVEGTEVQVDFGTYSADVSVPEVNDHCADPNLPNIPSYKVWAGVSVFCDSYSPPEAICTTGGDFITPNPTCTNFESGTVGITGLSFN